VDGADARFMQVRAANPGATTPVSALFFEAPGENTARLNKDLFVSREAMSSLCLHCAPVSLFLVQSHARMGGGGYYVGPRAVSVLAAVIEAETLWETIVLNLLPVQWFDDKTGSIQKDTLRSFPWTNAEAKLDIKGERPLGDFGRFGVLWWTPLALRLNVTANTDGRECCACGEVHAHHVETLSWKSTPARLAGPIRHPRTGWNPEGNKGTGRAIEVPDAGFTFEQWQALTIGASLDNSLPAWSLLDRRQAEKIQLRMFGFAMQQNTALAWLDVTTPVLVPSNPTNRAVLKEASQVLLEIADKAATSARQSLYRDSEKATGNPEVPMTASVDQTSRQVWEELGPVVTRVLSSLGEEPVTVEAVADFTLRARNVALKVFDQMTIDYGENIYISRGLMARRANLFKKLTPKK